MHKSDLLCRKLRLHVVDTGDIASRPVQAGEQASLDGIDASTENDRNCCGCAFGRERSSRASWRGNNSYPTTDQIRRHFWQTIEYMVRPTIFDRHVLALEIAGFTQTFAERLDEICAWLRRPSGEITDHRHRWLLRPRRERPRHRA